MLTAFLFSGTPVLAADEIGTATRIVNNVYGTTLNRPMEPGEALVTNQKVRTGIHSAADLTFHDGSTLVVGPRSEVTLDRFAFDPESNVVRGSIRAARGLMRFASGSANLNLTIRTGVATVEVRGTGFDFLVKRNATEIVVREGTVEVMSQDGTNTLEEGQVLSVSGRDGANRERAASQEMEIELKQTFKLLGTTSKQHLVEWLAKRREEKAETNQAIPKSLVSVSPTQAPSSNDEENLLYVDLDKGRVVIELKPSLAPRHVARIRELVRQGFYNGLTFHNVVAKQVAVTGDPTGTGRGGTGQTQANEVSGDPFIRGSVGMMPAPNDPGKTDSQIFICTGRMQHLDSKYTLLGQVVNGMELIDALNTGQPPKMPDEITRVRVAADVEEK